MADKITREFDAHKALAKEAKEPNRVQAAPNNPFTIDAR